MCYMENERARVGVRELRQNLSVYLRRVEGGEVLEVTERGRSVAVLAPLPKRSTALGRLAAAGKVRMPVGELLDLGAPGGAVSGRLSEALREEREERI
jgi:prevent-host-death family protein